MVTLSSTIVRHFFVQASTGFHLVYIAASTLIDIKRRRRESSDEITERCFFENDNSNSGERCWYEPILLFLLHLAAVIVSSMNFFLEQVSGFLQASPDEMMNLFAQEKEWCCRVFPLVEAWLTLILPLLLVILITLLIYKWEAFASLSITSPLQEN